ncbi:cof family had hydrolase protein [Mycoplasmopsis columbina SF7]|uniref:Cof family had hydrolase protein n=1 Tax=Mycoplasmopsis columbina SF7 TaxID=1037410 RepID=F9UK37_9BACT|nr:HAD-IIB family hydrolase [Mycoplasmopsis columbina]EGV00042.1 cof family had hydrolase protein [Mycoplasmopsis columbina SF7]
MKKNYKAYFVDLDGTFIDQHENELSPISEQNLEIAKEINKNKHFIISTGRSNSSFVMNLAKKINSKYVICQNGAVIVDVNNNVLRFNIIEKDLTYQLKDFLERKNLNYTLNGDPVIYTNDENSVKLDRPWAKKFTKAPYSKVNLEQTVNRFLAFGLPSEDATRQLAKEIETKFPELRTHLVSMGLSLEITNKLSSKGVGNKFICDLLQIDVKDAVHLGDSGNDICVKEENFDLVIMNNAIDSIKPYGDLIGEDYRNGGVAKTISKLEKNEY